MATLDRMFPKAAKKASRFMGRWKDVDEQKVIIMKLAPISENTDDTREVIWRISSSRVVQAIFDIYTYIYISVCGLLVPEYDGRFIQRWSRGSTVESN